MEFDEVLIQQVQTNPVKRTLALISEVRNELDLEQMIGEDGWDDQQQELLVRAGALVVELLDAGMLPIHAPRPSIGGNTNENGNSLWIFLQNVESALQEIHSKSEYDDLRLRFKAALGTAFSYQFSTGDLERVQELLNELRDQIASASKLEDEHRRRLLLRLEKLQDELHKKMSDLDRFWGLCGDAGVVLAKLGNDAKPIVDRIRELASIVWNTQARAEELPSGTEPPLLGHGGGDDDHQN